MLPGARVHGRSPNGKLVVTLDANSAAEMLARLLQGW
jgi:nitrate reductase NapAB chaperone NapD